MSSKYLLSFVALSLQAYESEELALLYIQKADWDEVKQLVVDDNYLQKGSISTRKREFVEFKKRVCSLTQEQLAYYANASGSDSRNLTLLSCFKLYPFIYDFAV